LHEPLRQFLGGSFPGLPEKRQAGFFFSLVEILRKEAIR
jgi:hypothetical protein